MFNSKNKKPSDPSQQGIPLLCMNRPINQSAISIYSSIFQQPQQKGNNQVQYEQLPDYQNKNPKIGEVPNDAYYQAINRQTYQIQQQKYQVNPYYLPNQQAEKLDHRNDRNGSNQYAKGGYQNYANYSNHCNQFGQNYQKQHYPQQIGNRSPNNIPYPGNQAYHNQKNFEMQEKPQRDYPEINRYSNHYDTPNFEDQNTHGGYQHQHQVIHKITPDDTLEGLSLTYGVSITKIKQRNQIQTDTIYYLKTLIIPNPQFQYLAQQLSNDTKITHVMGFLDPRDRSKEVAQFYLSQNDWEIQKAVKQYKKDLQWDKHNQIKSIPISQMQNNPFGKWNPSSINKQKMY